MLENLKVLDFTRLLPGPFATKVLADLGCEVIKIEDTTKGDYARHMPPLKDKMGQAFMSLNRGKKSLSIDLSTQAGKELIYQLVADFDVVVESFRPGVMEQIGMDYETLKKYNPKLIYCSLSGHGQKSPLKEKAAHDLNFLSLAGLLPRVSGKNGRPVMPWFPVADLGSLYGVIAILGAILEKVSTGKGKYLDISLLDTALTFNIFGLMNTSLLLGDVANYNIYQTKDGQYVSLGALEKKFWIRFCEMLEKNEWIDKHNLLGQAGKDFITEVQDLFLQKTKSEWVTFFKGSDCCFTPVLNFNESLQLEHYQMRNMVENVVHPQEGNYIQLNGPISNKVKKDSFAPYLGENSTDILSEFGVSADKIQELKSNSIIN